MPDRDRLIELKTQFVENFNCENCTPEESKCKKCLIEKETDYLLANGVIVQPKTVFAWYDIGEYVYYHNKGYGKRSKIPILRKRNSLITKLDSSYRGIDGITKIEIREIPYKPHYRSYLNKTIFLTKEQAEKALKEQNNGTTQEM